MLSRDNPYYQQVELLVAVLPAIARYPDFSLKGGTAINLFIQAMPRLSVDIDLTYLPLHDRETALAEMGRQLNRIADDLETQLSGTQVKRFPERAKLQVHRNKVQIKIEVSQILRGTVLKPVKMDICDAAEDTFGYLSTQVNHQDELYAGKFCAALDRQHPRDLFDVMIFMQTCRITERLINVFIVYLLSSNRPIAEMLNPNLLDMSETYNNQFAGMALQKVELQDLEQVRKNLIETIQSQLNEKQKAIYIILQTG